MRIAVKCEQGQALSWKGKSERGRAQCLSRDFFLPKTKFAFPGLCLKKTQLLKHAHIQDRCSVRMPACEVHAVSHAGQGVSRLQCSMCL